MPLPAIWLRRSSMPSGISVIKLLFIMALRIIGQLFNISPMTSQPDSLWTFPNFLKGYFVPCGVTTLFLRLLSNGWSCVETSIRFLTGVWTGQVLIPLIPCATAALSHLFDACCVVDVWRFLYLTG